MAIKKAQHKATMHCDVTAMLEIEMIKMLNTEQNYIINIKDYDGDPSIMNMSLNPYIEVENNDDKSHNTKSQNDPINK